MEPVAIEQINTIRKSPFCIALEELSDTLKKDALNVPVAPSFQDKVVTFKSVLRREGTDDQLYTVKESKTCSIFETFSSNKDFIRFVLCPNLQSCYNINVLCGPLWVKLCTTGDYVHSKIFQLVPKANQELEIVYVISNKDYATASKLVTLNKESLRISKYLNECNKL